jgi:hypothetical protein
LVGLEAFLNCRGEVMITAAMAFKIKKFFKFPKIQAIRIISARFGPEISSRPGRVSWLSSLAGT